METLTPATHRRATARRWPTSTYHHARIHVTSRQPTEFVDLTDRLVRLVADARLCVGILNVQTLHTTTAVIVNEHEPLLLADFQAVLEATVPGNRRYRHDDTTARSVNVTGGERPNGHAHCRALLLPSSACFNVVDGRLFLGRWQRVFLVELDGPRERDVSVLLLGEASE